VLTEKDQRLEYQTLSMPDNPAAPMTVIYCILVLFLGGILKGAIGVGLPQVGVSLTALALGLRRAVGLMVLPIMASNFSQSWHRELFVPVSRRFLSLLMATFLSSATSVSLFGLIPEDTLMLSSGVLVIILPTITFFRPQLRITPRHEIWAGPLTGMAAGVMGGLSSLSGPPLMIYLSCLRLPKDEFVVAVSLMFLAAGAGLSLGLLMFGISRPTDFGLSAIACVPVFVGMFIGQRARVKMTERAFAVAVLLTYVFTGVSFLAKAFLK
jgi:uncharacterized protein